MDTKDFMCVLQTGLDAEGVMICPVCELELGIERLPGELVLTYSVKEWTARCRCRQQGDPVSCAILRPTILTLLPEAKSTPFRSEPRTKDEC